MSVADEKEKIEKLTNTLVHAYRYKGVMGGLEEPVVSYSFIQELRQLYKNDENKISECVINKIQMWGNRLYWMNQTAMFITYSDIPRNLVDIDESKITGSSMPLTWKEIYSAVQMIEYNCTSNGGTITLSKDDEDSLNQVARIAASRVVLS